MMNEYTYELDCYRNLNEVSEKGGVVIFGSTFTKNIPASELGQTFKLNCGIYNRSFTDLSVFDADELVDEAVISLSPKKVILQLGETDLARGYKSHEEILNAYEKLITKLKKSDKHVKIILASVCSEDDDTKRFNASLENLSKKCKCQYADVTKANDSKTPFIEAFKKLRYFMLDQITFFDAMNLC